MSSNPELSAQSPLTTGESEVIAIFVQMTQVLGVPRSLGEIYGLLFATPAPLAFQDIADRLKLSKGSVSQGLRFLRAVGAIKPVVVTGDRREFFEPETELRALVSGFLRERLNPQLESWGSRAKALKIEDFLSADLNQNQSVKSEELKTLSSRLDKLKTWQKRANTVLPMVGKLLG
jgi:HTH-type transcriptional regulator, glycine betaine synthesis regulator